MLLIDQYKHIKSRADFFKALDAALRETEALLKQTPDATIAAIEKQLRAIEGWTANGREPTKQERWSTNIGLRLSREFANVPDPKIEAWSELCNEVEGYFNAWLEDPVFQTVDDEELPDFEEEEDEDTHLRLQD